jgi:ribonuclease HI
MSNFSINKFLEDIQESIGEQREKHFNKAINRIENIYTFRNSIINEIFRKAESNGLIAIRNAMVQYDGVLISLDLEIYDNDESILSIELTSSNLKRSILNLLHNQSLNKLLISYYRDISLCKNFLKLYDKNNEITLLHLPNLKYIVPKNVKDIKDNLEIKDVNSPLEVLMEHALKEAGVKYVCQYAVYDRKDGRRKWEPKYITDFAVFGEFSRIALECDGLRYHFTDEARARDTERDIWLINTGFDDVIHFNSDQIKENISHCIEMVEKSINSWDQFRKKRLLKGENHTITWTEKEYQQNVKDVVSELISIIRKIPNRRKQTCNVKEIIKAIFKSGYSTNIQTIYFQYPKLSKLIESGKIQCSFLGYGIPFLFIYIEKLSDCNIPNWLRKEKGIIKLIVYQSNSNQEKLWDNIQSYFLIESSNGFITSSDFTNQSEASQKEEQKPNYSPKEKNYEYIQEREIVGIKTKYYVVWKGNKEGIYTTWDECKKQVLGVPGSKFKSFSTLEEAKEAYKKGDDYTPTIKTTKDTKEKDQQTFNLFENTSYIEESICVDAACSGNPGAMEYKGVYTKTGRVLFHYGPIHGTNNIGEFLAIVHGLSMLKKYEKNFPIYSDSLTAIKWVRLKKANSSLPRNKNTERVWNLIDRAENWLNQNKYDTKILKWETNRWGEVKADFGRK